MNNFVLEKARHEGFREAYEMCQFEQSAQAFYPVVVMTKKSFTVKRQDVKRSSTGVAYSHITPQRNGLFRNANGNTCNPWCYSINGNQSARSESVSFC